MHLQVWQMYTVQTGSCDGAAGYTSDGRVLPGSMEVQVWQQAQHALNSSIDLVNKDKVNNFSLMTRKLLVDILTRS